MSSKVLTAFFEQLNTLLCRDYILICTMVRSVKEVLNDTYINTFPIRIELPDLRQRPLSERLEFVEKFFMDEAEKVKKEIQIDSELLRCFYFIFVKEMYYSCKMISKSGVQMPMSVISIKMRMY